MSTPAGGKQPVPTATRAAPVEGSPRPGNPLTAGRAALVRYHALRPDGSAGCNARLWLADWFIAVNEIPYGQRCAAPGCDRRWPT